MAINKTIDLLPEYFRTIPNQRFLNSTLDRLVSDPNLRNFDGYVGRRLVNGTPLAGNYITEPSTFRTDYQLEPEFVFAQPGSPTRAAGFKDVLNSVASQGGRIDAWNRLLTDNSYTYQGFVALDKLTNYFNYVWIPEPRKINGTRVDENPWFRTPVTISNSTLPTSATYTVTRTSKGLSVTDVDGLNPAIFLSRGGNYTFKIQPNDYSAGIRTAKSVTQLSSVSPVLTSSQIPLFGNSSGQFVAAGGLVVADVVDFNFKYSQFAVECWVWIDSNQNSGDQVIVGQWSFNDTANSSWALIRTGSPNTLKFSWVDAGTGAVSELVYDSGAVSTGAWHHVAVTRASGTARLYVDGYQAVTGSMGTIARSDKALTIGADTQNSMAFRGFINDLRITNGYARYTDVYYELPSGTTVNDNNTVLLINFDGVLRSSVFTDNTQTTASRTWIQSHPGTPGFIPSNPNLTARDILGVNNNGVTTGDIVFNVPRLADESYWRNLSVTGTEILDFVDLATDLQFDQIDGKSIDTFVQVPASLTDSDLTGHRGGIDGVTDLNGKTLIFVAGQSAGWQRVEPFEFNGLEAGNFENTTPILNSQWYGIWTCQVINGLIRLNFVANISSQYRVKVKNGSTYRNTGWYKTTNNSTLVRVPSLSGNLTTLFLQDDQNTANILPLGIINTDVPVLDIDREIVGQKYYTSGNGVKFIDGLRVTFGLDAVPASYCNLVLVYQSTFTNQIGIADATIALLDVGEIQPGFFLEANTETMLVHSVDYQANTVTVTRGYNSIATAHGDNSWCKILTLPSYIVEGVGSAITLVPYQQLTTQEPYLDNAQNPDYITVNRASADRNPWSRTNRWFNYAVIENTLAYLQAQGVTVSAPNAVSRAVRPILEFRSGLKLYDFGTHSLAQVQLLDSQINDAQSNINGRRVTDTQSLTLNGHLLVDGDLVIFNNDTEPQVRSKVYQIQYVDVDGDLNLFSRAPVRVASTTNVNISNPGTIDGVTLQPYDRVLLWKQTNAAHNGIYYYISGRLERSDDVNSVTELGTDFYVYASAGTDNINSWFRYVVDLNTVVLGTTPLSFKTVSAQGPVVTLTEYATALSGDCVVVNSADANNRGTNWYWDAAIKYWTLSSQQKTQVQQAPKFDVFDYTGVSYADTSVYDLSSFAGSTLIEYQRNASVASDPVLEFGLTYRNLANVGDITFLNTYESDIFTHQINNNPVQIAINQGVARRTDVITGAASEFSPWQQALTNLELYQNISATGTRTIQVSCTLLNKTTANNTLVFVDGHQISPDNFTVQVVSNTVLFTIGNAVSVNTDSTVLVKLIAATPIVGAYYDVPTAYDINPYNQRPVSFTHNDIKQHTDAMHHQHGHGISPADTENSLDDPDHQGKPGLIMLHEGFSVLSTLMLTDNRYNIDRALKNAAADYELFKLKFLQAGDQVENIVNLGARDGVDQIFAVLVANHNPSSAWYTSDMVPVGGTVVRYTVDDPQQQYYDISQQLDQVASNRAVLVYLNGQHLVRGTDYEVFTGRPAVQIMLVVRVDDLIEIVEYPNTDGCYMPATPAKLGLGAAYVPSKYTDDTYQESVLVIQGHDGSITRAFNDYRDALLMELELRIYNNIKVNSELWNQVIENRVPTAGRFRELNGLATYSMTEQASIQRKFFYEWVAENHVNFRTSVYKQDKAFTYNYTGSTDKITGDPLLGYWRGSYRDFYDTDRPHTHPWEILGLSVKPTWWQSTYGPAPYTGENLILWQDLMNGVLRHTGEVSATGYRTTNVYNTPRTARLGLLDVIPVSASGKLLDPNVSLTAILETQSLRVGFTFNDGGPAETAWRHSSTFPFSQLRTKILQNPQFMLGTLWDLDSYCPHVRHNTTPTVAGMFDGFKYLVTQIPSIADVELHNVDTDAAGKTVRKHSMLNYIVEYLTTQGDTATLFKNYITHSTVNLVYNLAGFADKGNLTVYAEQNSPQTIQQTVRVPAEDYSLLLSQSTPVGQVTYSGVIITQSVNGYKITGYDQEYPFFIISPSNPTGKSTSITVGSQSFTVYQEYADQPIYVPYGFEFSNRQTVVDFLVSYGAYLQRLGFLFDTDAATDRVTWTDAAVQFVKWSYYNWAPNQGVNRISLVLNPSSGVLKFRPVAGTLDSLLNPGSLLLDENQFQIDTRYLDVLRDSDVTYINNQLPYGVISALRANLINFEHKLILNNRTVFNDLIYNPALGTRQNRLRITGLKSGDWNGTLASAGFMMMLSEVAEWQPNTDYLRGSIVRYKNQNWTALTAVIGASKFQQLNFSVTDTVFQDQLMPSIGAKALDLEHAYDPYYHNSIPDMVRLRCDALGYVERTWLASLGLDLLNQTEFYRGWIKQKGTPQAIKNFTSAGTTDLLADFAMFEEYAIKMGEYGATGRTGYVDVQLNSTVAVNNPVAVEFAVGNSDTNIIRVSDSALYKKPLGWNANFIQTLDEGYLNDSESPFLSAGPVLPSDIYDFAQSNTLEYNSTLQHLLTFPSKLSMTTETDTGNLLRNIRNHNWFWIAVDEVSSAENKYNVITWKLSAAYIKQVVLNTAQNTIDLYLSSGVDAYVGDIVAVDITQAQGVFTVYDYRVQPSGDYYSVLRLQVADITQYTFDNITYTDVTAPQGIYTYTSLRHNDIGSATLDSQVNRLLLPVLTRAYVDYDTTGFAVYDFREPYVTGQATLPAGSVVTTSIAQDEATKLLWLGQATANQVSLKTLGSAKLSAGDVTGLDTVVHTFTATGNSSSLGSQVVNLTSGLAVATATDSINSGQLYILKYTPTVAEVSNKFYGASGSYLGSSISASADGVWLVAGAPNPSGVGFVQVYQRVSSTYSLVQTIADPGNTTAKFGSSVSLSADGAVLAVGAPSAGNGKVYTFSRASSTFTLTQTLSAVVNDEKYGASVAVNGDLLAIGSSQSTQVIGSQTLHQLGKVELWNYYSSAWHLIQTINNTDVFSTGFGQQLSWLTTKVLAVVENHADFVQADQLHLESNIQFDSGGTVMYDSAAQPGQRLSQYQLLRTSASVLSAQHDTIQLTRVKTIQYQSATGVNLCFAGNLQRLWVGNSLATTDGNNVVCYTNDNALSGWTMLRQQQPTLDAHSLFRAWIYNSRTQQKIVDLDVVDLSQGLLPGVIAQHIDYISGNDPAVYGVALWRSGITYEVGSRVVYDDTVYVANQIHSAVFFNTVYWTVLSAQSRVANTGSVKWGAAQVGLNWFSTRQLRTVNYHQGELMDRVANYNTWFPGTQINIYEWTASTVPPSAYTGTGTVTADAATVYDSQTSQWYFWVANKTQPSGVHTLSTADISNALTHPQLSGLPMISPANAHSVILYNVANEVNNGENVLHIDYVLEDHTNRLHSEFLMLSEDGSGHWLTTPIYTKMVDSLCGQSNFTYGGVTTQLEVPDPALNTEDRYGVAFRPRQSLFRDRNKAAQIYFQQINTAIASQAVANLTTLSLLRQRDPMPTTGFDATVADRDTLLILDVRDYVNNTVILIHSDSLATNSGWSRVKLVNGKWEMVTSEFYNLNVYWQYQDWSSVDYTEPVADNTIAHIGYLPSINLVPGQYLKILNNGDGNAAMYQIQADQTLNPVWIQNGTIQFKPNLYDAVVTGDGLAGTAFDTVAGFDSYPALPLRMILTALNQHILTGDLMPVADSAFFAVMRFVLQENLSVDWLFRTSFINVKHRVKNLNRQTNYRQDDEQFVRDFVNETNPYHTRIREYTNVYSATDTALTATSDFDLPALYDAVWYADQYPGSYGKLISGQARYFTAGIALAQENGLLYVGSNGMAIHAMGLWPNTTVTAATPQHWVFALNQTPTETVTKYPVPANNIIGVAINGVPFYSVVAAETDTLTWVNDPSVTETYTVNIAAGTSYVGPDASNGYLTATGAYVYRANPALLYTPNTSQHSPVIGFALDGFPIYGPYGYRRVDGSGGIVQNTSSYRLRNDYRLSTQTVVNGQAYADYAAPTGEYIGDWEYVSGLGTLDEHNGRFVKTPEYPYGTYAYFVTVDTYNHTTPVYPYIVGPTFQGVPTGLKYNYVGESSVAMYENGNYQMPAQPAPVSSDWSLRSPTGLFPNDEIRFTQGVYSNWNNHHTYNLTGLTVAYPGHGYSSTPIVTITGGGGSGATARVTVNPLTQQLNPTVTLTSVGTGYTSQPLVEVIGGFNVLTWAGSVVVSVLTNNVTLSTPQTLTQGTVLSFGDIVTASVAHTVTANVSSNATIQLNSVTGITPGMKVTGNNVATGTGVVYKPGDVILYEAAQAFYEATQLDSSAQVAGVKHTVQTKGLFVTLASAATSSNVNITVESVTDILIGMTVSSTNITNSPTVSSVNTATKTVTLSSPQSVTAGETLTFTLNSANVTLESVSGIVTGMVVTGAHIVANTYPTVTNVDAANSKVTVSSAQTLARYDQLSFVAVTYDSTNTTLPVVSNIGTVIAGMRVVGQNISVVAVSNISTFGNANVTVESVTDINSLTGMTVFSNNITDFPTVSSVDAATKTVTLSKPETVVVGETLTFTSTTTVSATANTITVTGDHRNVVANTQLNLSYLYGNPSSDTAAWTQLSLDDILIPRSAVLTPVLTNSLVRKPNITMQYNRKAAVEYPSVLVDSVPFTDTYTVVNATMADQDDTQLDNVVLQLAFNTDTVTENIWNYQHRVAGARSASFSNLGGNRYLTANTTISGLGLNDFTIEFWFRMQTVHSTQALFSTSGIIIYVNELNQVCVSDTTNLLVSGGSVTTNIWQHVVVERKYNTVSLYLDGYRLGQYTADNYQTHNFSGVNLTLGTEVTPANTANAFMDELRITSGVLRYDAANYAVPQGAFGRTVLTDAYHSHVTLLYGFESLSATANSITVNFVPHGVSTVVQDRSVNSKLVTVNNPANLTVNNTVISTAHSEILAATFTAGAYVDAGTSTDFNLGTDDFTIEFWMDPDSDAGTIFTLAAGTTHSLTARMSDATHIQLLVKTAAASTVMTLTGTISSGAHFISVERYQQRMMLYVDGVLVDQDDQANYSFGTSTNTVPLMISAASAGFTGKLGDFRVTAGLARHTPVGNFDTLIHSDFTDTALGMRSADVVIDGSGFVTNINCPADDEHVNGRLYDTLDVRVFSNGNLNTANTGFRMFKDMLDNVSYYAIPATGTTTLTQALNWYDTEIRLANVSGFFIQDPTQNRWGTVFVNGERIAYLNVDPVNNLLTGIIRGTLGTHTPAVHAISSRTEAAGDNLTLPGTQALVGVAHTVTANVSSNATIQLDSVTGITPGMKVTRNNVATSVVVSALTNYVTLATPQTLTQGTVLSFGDIVAHTVTANVSSNATIQLDSVTGITPGMKVTRNNVATSVVVSALTNYVTLATPQTLTRGTVLSFGDIVTASVGPFTTVNTNSLTAYRNTWNTLGSGVATDGQGLQLSSTDIAVFLINNPAQLPV